MARTADLPCSFMGVPTPFSVKVTDAQTWFKGSLIFQLAAGGEGLIFMGPFIWKVPDTTAGLAAGDEGDDIQMPAAGDDWLLCTKANAGIGTNTASLIGRLLRFVSVTEIYIAIKDPSFFGVSKAAATATLFTP